MPLPLYSNYFKKVLLFVLVLITSQAFGQLGYELYEKVSTKEQMTLNSKIKTETGLLLTDSIWRKQFVFEYNKAGLPITMDQFTSSGVKNIGEQFVYDSHGNISSVEVYKMNKHFQSTEFKVNKNGQIITYSDYVYNSLDSEKIHVFDAYITYYKNGIKSLWIKINATTKDTEFIKQYNNDGQCINSVLNLSRTNHVKNTFTWNTDKTQLIEKEYDNGSLANTVIHNYVNNKEVERIDTRATQGPVYWKYDSNGRVLETNEAVYSTSNYAYNKDGRVLTQTYNILFSEPEAKGLIQKMYYKFEYEDR